jgi:NTP pyrophosphatase (non-canonical NTP hydrolase)
VEPNPERSATDLSDLEDRLRRFRDARDWEQFHSPRQLATALSIESSEVLEHFLWVSDSAADAVAVAKRADIGEELADVLIYLLYLADRIGVDLLRAAALKVDRNEKRFPLDDGG